MHVIFYSSLLSRITMTGLWMKFEQRKVFLRCISFIGGTMCVLNISIAALPDTTRWHLLIFHTPTIHLFYSSPSFQFGLSFGRCSFFTAHYNSLYLIMREKERYVWTKKKRDKWNSYIGLSFTCPVCLELFQTCGNETSKFFTNVIYQVKDNNCLEIV